MRVREFLQLSASPPEEMNVLINTFTCFVSINAMRLCLVFLRGGGCGSVFTGSCLHNTIISKADFIH